MNTNELKRRYIFSGFGILAAELCPFVDERMIKQAGDGWLFTYPANAVKPSKTDPSIALKVIIERGLWFDDLGNKGRQAAKRLLDARHELFHFDEPVTTDHEKTVFVDIKLILQAIDSPRSVEIDSIVWNLQRELLLPTEAQIDPLALQRAEAERRLAALERGDETETTKRELESSEAELAELVSLSVSEGEGRVRRWTDKLNARALARFLSKQD